MNSKAIKKQLLAAVAMVLVAAVALGSSTYAWFVAAGEVTAEGMQVKAVADSGLIISYCGENDAWGTVATANKTVAELKPASTADFKKWTTAAANAAGASAIRLDTVEDVTSTVVTDSDYSKTIKTMNGKTDYQIMEQFKIRAVGEDTKGLYVSEVKVTSTSNQNLDDSLRVGIIVKDTDKDTSFIMAPLDQANANSDGARTYTFHGSEQESDVTEVTAYAPGPDHCRLLDSEAAVPGKDGTPIQFQIVIWYEGEDTQLYTDNILSDNSLDISVVFKADSMANET